MEVPNVLKTNVRLVLLSKNNGIYLDNLCEEFQCLVNKPLNYQRFGFRTLETFLRAIPDAARLDYTAGNNTIKVFGVVPQKKTRPGVDPTLQIKKEVIDIGESSSCSGPEEVGNQVNPAHRNPDADTGVGRGPGAGPGVSRGPSASSSGDTGVHTNSASVNPGSSGTAKDLAAYAAVPSDSLSGTSTSTGSRDGTRGDPVFAPDNRGLYSVGFLAKDRPDTVEPLEDFFSIAGKVAEVEQTHRWIFVRYHDAKSASRACRMFQDVRMKPASACVSPPARTVSVSPQRAQKRDKRNLSGGISSAPGFHQQQNGKKRRMHREDGPSYRVYVGNLDPEINYTFPMFYDLFRGYTILWITMKPSVVNGTSRLCAFVLLPNREQAEQLAAEFMGFDWLGRQLVTEVKEKQRDVQKKAIAASTDEHDDSSLPELTDMDDMPGLEPLAPRLEQSFPGLRQGILGPAPNMPGLEPGRLGPAPNTTRLEPDIHRPGPSMPGLEPGMPRLEPGMPGLEPSMPGLEPSMPGLEPSMPGLEPSMPGLEPSMPGLEPLPGMPNFRGRRSVDSSLPHREVPTILVTHFLDEITEDDLLNHFSSYGARSVNMVPTLQGRKKAYIQLGSIDDVKRAVEEMDQVPFRGGLKLKVDVPYNMPWLREVVLGVENAQPRPPAPRTQAPRPQAPAATTGTLTVSEILKVRSNCLQILQTPEHSLKLGDHVKILITTVISDRFFWGQVADMPCMEQLQRISDRLNRPGGHREAAKGPGRCAALFQGDGKWYRAWAMHEGADGEKVRVFYLDYGNTDVIPWTYTAMNSERAIWELQPMAIPFTLTDPVTNLRSRELTHMMGEINACGSPEEGHMVVIRATSLIPDLKESVSSIGQTVIM